MKLGGSVIAANDEFFAERENLLRREPPHFDPEDFGHKGKVMDGWETRRRRGASAATPHPADEDHDWALVRLGRPAARRASQNPETRSAYRRSWGWDIPQPLSPLPPYRPAFPLSEGLS